MWTLITASELWLKVQLELFLINKNIKKFYKKMKGKQQVIDSQYFNGSYILWIFEGFFALIYIFLAQKDVNIITIYKNAPNKEIPQIAMNY